MTSLSPVAGTLTQIIFASEN